MIEPSKFLRVVCKECKNEQFIFNKPCSEVKCLKCGKVLVEPSGGKGIVKTTVVEAY